ncbi:MAG TPA: N,N-dimethylformamidase beta subunit family domain-containing protein [Solirubrobacterales bacterium]|nr:N,N-dimethylformamidase beta subunit family domain-containing protein [Solirubrobacterales bacterium]
MLCCLALALLLGLPATGMANPITDENALAGSSGWERSQADAPNVEGYTSKTSVAPGETIGFHVSTKPTNNFRIVVYRLGWYNGAGARQMTCLPSCTTSFSGASQSTPDPNSATGEVDAGWPQSASLTIPSNWTTGEYVAEYVLTSGSQSGTARYSPFVVRSNAPQAQASSLLVVVPFNTYNAYNEWGGTSSYVNNAKKSIFSLAHATKVSFNRPFHRREWRFWDIDLLRFLEREGYDVSYVSDTDVDANPQILQQHRAVIVSGHSEYWSQNMRNGFDAARDAGTNLFFTGANDAYWQVRYEDSSCADDNTVCGTVGDRRTMVIYKEEGNDGEDPNTNPSLETIQWRDLGRPECELQGGVQYGSWFPNDGYRDYTTTADGAADPWAAGTGLSNGSTVSGLVGFEYDSFFPNCSVPGTPKILFAYQGPETSAQFDSAAVKYTANGSGARVFSSGTEQWAWGLDSYRWDPTLFTGIPPTNPAIQQFTRNLLADMARPAPPAGLTANASGGSIQMDTTPRGDSRITSYKIYRHAGTGAFQPGDAGVTLVCQNLTGDCTDTPAAGTYRYASVAVDQWNDSGAALSQAVDNLPPPTAVDDSATISEDGAATGVPVLSNETNPSGGPITISSASDPAHGSVILIGGSPGANTGLTYQPDANYCNNPPGTSLDTFTYTINGGSTATVSMTVTCVDDPPVAVHDSKSVIEDDPATAVDVLANDTDSDGGPKTVASVTQPAHGTVVRNSDGSGLTYQPAANYCNFPGGAPSDDFSYTLNGGSTASVSMTVDCVDDPPLAANDSKTVSEDDPATAVDVLANDGDSDGGPKTIQSASDPANGTVAITGGGTGLTYKPDSNYCNTPSNPKDTFSYTLDGGSTAMVSMTVRCVDDAPTAADDSGTTTEGTGATAISVLANDTDVDDGPRTIDSVTQGAHGSIEITGGGTGLTYDLDDSYCNDPNGPPANPSDSFTYTLNGGSTGTVSVTIACVDEPPVAVEDNSVVSGNSGPNTIGVLANDTDVDGGPKTISSFTTPGHGSVTGAGGPTNAWTSVRYQPITGYCGPDSFDYIINGGSTATVSITVDCSIPPNAVNDNATVGHDAPATPINVLANDTDSDGGPMVITGSSDPAHGTVVVDIGGTGLNYKPDVGYCNTPSGPTDNFTYTLNGGPTGTVFMTVMCAAATPNTTLQQTGTIPSTKKCKKGFKRVKGKCKKKKRKRN